MKNKTLTYYLIYMYESKAEDLLYVLELPNDCMNTTIPLSKAIKEQVL